MAKFTGSSPTIVTIRRAILRINSPFPDGISDGMASVTGILPFVDTLSIHLHVVKLHIHRLLSQRTSHSLVKLTSYSTTKKPRYTKETPLHGEEPHLPPRDPPLKLPPLISVNAWRKKALIAIAKRATSTDIKFVVRLLFLGEVRR